MSADVDIRELLGELGFGLEESQSLALAELETQGVTRPGKARISLAKRDRVREILAARFAVLCSSPSCVARGAHGRTVVLADPISACEHCAGSGHQRAFRRLAEAAAKKHVRRFVIVGGSPTQRLEVEEGRAPGWELRMVDGTERHTARQAEANLAWADLVLVWGSTELDHKVSRLYTQVQGADRRKIVHLARRGVEALLDAASDHLER